jgi:hypothetical protein
MARFVAHFCREDHLCFHHGEWKRLEKKMTDKNTTVQGTAKAQEPRQQQQAASNEAGLQQRYGSIGIEAVAAACRYSNPGKKTVEPVRAPRIDQRFEQAV